MIHRVASPVDWSWKTERHWLWQTDKVRIKDMSSLGRRKIQDWALGMDSPQDFLVKSSAPTSKCLGSSVTLTSGRQCSTLLAWPIIHATAATQGKQLTLHLQCAATWTSNSNLPWVGVAASSSSSPLLLPSLPLLLHSTEGPSVPKELCSLRTCSLSV